MGLELLSQADYVLNACGRPVPPKGYKFVDLPRIIPFHQTVDFTAAVAASRIYGDDQSSILITAVNPGAAGNSIVIQLDYVPPGGFPPNQASSVSVVGDTITYLPATNAAGAVIYNPPSQGTNLQLLQAFAASAAASALVTASLNGGPITASGFGKIPSPGNLQNGANATGSTAFPTQARLENIANTLFIVKGIVLETDPVQIRIRWPNGRYWNQFPFGNTNTAVGPCNPQGSGGNMYALDDEVAIERGAKIAVEMSGPNGGTVDVGFWGVLRYLLKATGDDAGVVDGQTCIVGYPSQAQSQGAPSCIIGYPVSAKAKGKTGLTIIRDPVEVLKERPRFNCWPNGNIMAPEFLLGNQCETDTPPGFEDEPFTFVSDPVTLSGGQQSYSNAVSVPGQDDLIIRRCRPIITWAAGASGTPLFGLRSPTGYSITGGDLIDPTTMYWIPVFPTFNMRAGTDLIFDVGFVAGTGQVTIQLEFDAAKRRKAK